MAQSIFIACPRCDHPIWCEFLKHPIAEFAFFKLMRCTFAGRCDHCGFAKTWWFVGVPRMKSLTEAGWKSLERYDPKTAALESQVPDKHPVNDAPPIPVAVIGDSIKCPCCNRRFKLHDQHRWDGTRHLTCGQQIIVTRE